MARDKTVSAAPPPAAADPRFAVEALPNRVVRAAAFVAVMHQDVAGPFCDSIQSTARESAACGLVLDMAALGKATPAAGWYALRRLKGMAVGRIALVGGNGFMRVFARTVLTLGRFGQFAFFRDEPTATAWAADGCRASRDATA